MGFQNSVTGPDLGLLCGSLVLVDEAAEYRPAPYLLPGEVRGRVIGLGRAELAAAMGSPSVVMALVLSQDRPQVPFAEDQHPVGDLGSDGLRGVFVKYPEEIRGAYVDLPCDLFRLALR